MNSFSDEVSKYINNCETDTKIEIMIKLRQLIHDELPEILEKINWGFPVFILKVDIAYIKNNKNYITFGFNNSQKIKTDVKKLEGTGNTMNHIKIYKEQDIDYQLLKVWIKELTRKDV